MIERPTVPTWYTEDPDRRRQLSPAPAGRAPPPMVVRVELVQPPPRPELEPLVVAPLFCTASFERRNPFRFSRILRPLELQVLDAHGAHVVDVPMYESQAPKRSPDADGPLVCQPGTYRILLTGYRLGGSG